MTPAGAIMNDRENEKKIYTKLVELLIADGYDVSVNDGGETTVKRSRDPDEIVAALRTTDEDTLIVTGPILRRSAVVQLVYGNAPDEVVADHSTSLQETMDKLDAWIEAQGLSG
jgi:hypothetical protein